MLNHCNYEYLDDLIDAYNEGRIDLEEVFIVVRELYYTRQLTAQEMADSLMRLEM